MKTKRGQAETENMLVVAAVVIIAMFLLYFMIDHISSSHKLSKSEDVVNMLIDKINAVSVLGSGTKDIVVVDIPHSVSAMHLDGQRVKVTIPRRDGDYNITKVAKVFVIGELPETRGLQQIHLQKINDTLVFLGQRPTILNIDPSCARVSELIHGVNVSLNGLGFHYNSYVLKEGTNYTGPNEAIGSQTVEFTAKSGYFTPGIYAMSVQNPDMYTSDNISFEVKGGSC